MSKLPMNVKRPVVDTLFGETIVDPYRWLEDGASAETKAWTDAQNARTRKYLDGDLRTKLKGRLDELLTIGFVSSPVLRTGTAGEKKQPRRYFHVRREGKQDQPIVYVREGLEGKDRVLLDPTKFGSDKTAALDWWYVSPDGSRVAYGASVSGNEQSTLYIRDVATGNDIADEIPRTRMSSVAWLPDGSGFFYTREPEPGTVPKEEEHYHRKVYQHRIGDHWKNDPLVFPLASDTRWQMTDVPAVVVSPSGRYLCVRMSHGWAKSSVLLKDLKAPKADFVTMVTGVDALFDPMFHRQAGKDVIFLRSNEGAPNYKIFRVDPTKPAKAEWKEIVAEGPDPIRDFDAVGNAMFLSYLHRASSRLERRTLDGKSPTEIAIGGIGTASVPHGDLDGDEAMFEVQSYAMPPSIKRIDLKKGKIDVWAKIEAPIDPSSIVIDQIEAKSKDGTAITAFVVHKKDVAKNSSAPGILYGYGGFNISQTPSFNRTVYAFLERGGVYCVANLRGGAEYGETWHRAGMLDKKQNVFDDAIAVAEKLTSDGWISPKRLAVQGGSNGGLLVGALITQRPDLFRAAVSAVPLLDMLRYHHFLIAKMWIPEYGSPEEKAAFAWLKAYSPYHRVVEGTAYPAVLFMTAESDSRVDPMHARKMAARMQEATSSDKPILVRIETKAGHGAGKPRHKQLEELSDQYTFLFTELGVSF
jgi:prolyl oligopeptidase